MFRGWNGLHSLDNRGDKGCDGGAREATALGNDGDGKLTIDEDAGGNRSEGGELAADEAGWSGLIGSATS